MKLFVLAVLLLSLGGMVRADEHLSARIEEEQRELRALITKAGSARGQPNASEADWRLSALSPFLTPAENERIVKLLRDPDVSAIVTAEQGLELIKQREMNGTPGFVCGALTDLVNIRWSHDPLIITFYREGLATRGDVVCLELWAFQQSVWDDSFVEPLIGLAEKTTSWITIDNSLSELNLHRAAWAGDATVPPRLSHSVLAKFPSVTNTSLPGPRPGDQLWCNVLLMLGKTHDLAMLAILRPHLNDKVLAGDGSYWIEKDDPPLRSCDKTAMAISELLGDKDSSAGAVGMPGIPYRNVHASYPKWVEWDQKIADLERRLNIRNERK